MCHWWQHLTDSDKIAFWSAIATFLGIFIAVALGFIQLRKLEKQLIIQNEQLATQNKQLITQQFSDYTKRYQEIVLNFPENINEQSFDIGALVVKEKHKLMRYMRLYFDLCFEEWLLHQKQLIDEVIWLVWLDGIQTALSKKAFKDAWNLIKLDTKYGQDFEGFVRKLIPDSDQ